MKEIICLESHNKLNVLRINRDVLVTKALWHLSPSGKVKLLHSSKKSLQRLQLSAEHRKKKKNLHAKHWVISVVSPDKRLSVWKQPAVRNEELCIWVKVLHFVSTLAPSIAACFWSRQVTSSRLQQWTQTVTGVDCGLYQPRTLERQTKTRHRGTSYHFQELDISHVLFIFVEHTRDCENGARCLHSGLCFLLKRSLKFGAVWCT